MLAPLVVTLFLGAWGAFNRPPLKVNLRRRSTIEMCPTFYPKSTLRASVLPGGAVAVLWLSPGSWMEGLSDLSGPWLPPQPAVVDPALPSELDYAVSS